MKTRFPSILGVFAAIFVAILAIAAFLVIPAVGPPTVTATSNHQAIICGDSATSSLALNVNRFANELTCGTNSLYSSNGATTFYATSTAGQLNNTSNELIVVNMLDPAAYTGAATVACLVAVPASYNAIFTASARWAGSATPVTQGGVSIGGVYLTTINAVAASAKSATSATYAA